MKNDKTIKLYVYVDGVNDVPFYGSDAGEYEAFILANGEQYITSEGFVFNVRNVNEQIEIGAFRYDAKRMGGAPTITCTLMYEDCLDDFWSENVYAKFNGEKYYLKQTPTSSYNNESTMYKHDLELVSERVILDNVYFFDAVVGNPQGDDKPVSNSTKVVFFGNIHEFVKRLNSSLEYAKLLKWEDGVDGNGNAIKIPKGYHVVVDNDANITTEEKLMSFEDQFFSNVLQEIYKTYEVPYYFEGKTIHIGWAKDDVVIPPLEYGVDNALLSITKNNANYKIVNRATATGSSDNIPFYYPNNSPKGEIAAISSNSNIEVTILDTELYSNEVKLDGVITRSNIDYKNLEVKHLDKSITSGETFSAGMGYGGIKKDFFVTFDAKDVGELSVSFASKVTKYILKDVEINDATFSVKYYMSLSTPSEDGYPLGRVVFTSGTLNSVEDVRIPIVKALDGYRLKITVSYAPTGKYAGKGGRIVYDASFDFGSESGWTYEGKSIELKDVGLKAEGTPSVGDTITQKLVKYVKTSQNLMPSIYRETDGEERFYNATNEIYPFKFVDGYELKDKEYVGEDGMVHHQDYHEYNNPYVEGRPKEHIFTVDDIKPTIKETEVNGLRIDMFSEFAYDLDDNDETVENEEGSEREYVHSYFFAKLRKLDFNLFDHAIENQPMTISFTSGDCGACNFEIGVTEEFPQKNPVQVNADGTLKRDANGRVICGQFEDINEDECQPQQQDTINHEVWIALKKEDTTYGILMPKAPKLNDAGEQTEAGHRPKACTRNPDGTVNDDGDTFVILGINLPQSYITNAEKKLEAEIIKYLQDNNDEKFTFSINFSRIYFEENNILDQLSENSKIRIIYDNKPYDLYVSSFSYSMSEGDVLPDIRVELDETLKVSQNALQNAISQVKSELGRAIGSIDIVGAATPYFIRKDTDDEAQGRINFKKGIKFGEGGKVEVLDNNSAKLTIEYLEVTKKASFTSLEIQEKTHVGGQILVTPAAINCGEVEEFDDYYRCYFQTKGTDGDEIFNQFAVGDQAICQTFNAWGSKYYWRLVVGIGEDYIDLSKTDCDEGSDIPSAGDNIIQMGNRNDKARQNAIVIAAYGDSSPSLIMYNGISSYSLVEKNITGIIWNPETTEPQMYSYGSFFFGDRQLNKNFITFQKKEGDIDKNLYINGTLTIGAGSEGLSNLSEWSDKQTQINNAQTSADNAKSAADNAQKTADDAKSKAEDAQARAGVLESTTSNLSSQITDIENNITETVEDINKRLDGVVENYFEEGVPTIDNYPASKWTTDNEKKNHIGDTYTNIQAYIDDETTPDAGKSWRWVYTDSEHSGYHWHPIADSDAVKALQDAAKAQSTADGKSTTFLRRPTNYNVGDLWILQSDTDHTAGKKGEILTAKTSSVAYDASHWSKEVVYTDDTNLNNFIGGEFATYKTNIQNQIDKKAQTWYQSTDPSTQWTTTSDKNEHIGDIWLNTSSNTVAGVEAGMTAIWNGSTWKPSKVPQEVFDKIDGKAQVFVSQPTNYQIGDLWILQSDSDHTAGKKGEILTAKTSSVAYDASHWSKEVSYTDDSKLDSFVEGEYATDKNNIQNQIDITSEEINNIVSDGILDIVEKRRLRDVLISICEINPSTINNYATDYLNYSEDNLITNPSDYVDGTINSSTTSTVKRYDGLLNTMNVSGKWHLRCRLYGTIGDSYRIAFGSKFISNDSFTEDGWKDFDLIVNYSDTIGEGFLFLGSANLSGNLTTGVSFTKEDVKIKGSLIDWYRRCIELDKGGTNYQDTYGQNAFDRAIDLYEYLEQYDIWNDAATTIPSDFSSKYQKLLNDYNESITILNYKTSDDDIEYLKNAFKDGKTVFSGGVVMSEAVAVKNAENEIEGILNGSDTFSDTEHGKIILASGIPSTSSSGSTDFAERVNESKSKIFEDGTITTKAIELGRFKLENIDPYFGWAISSDYNDTMYSTTHRISMDSRRFLARSERKQGNNDVTSQVILNPSGAGKELTRGIIDVFSSDIVQYGIYISTQSTGISVSSNGQAIDCEKGVFAGLRPMSRAITSSTSLANRYLSPSDHTLFIPDSATDIYLPSSPLEGQEYVILVPNGGVNIYGNGKTILLFYDGVERQSFTCGDIATRVEVRLYWNKDDDKWWATFIKH